MAKRNVTDLLNKLNTSPSISAGMKTDNKIYALVNGVYEEVAPSGCDLLYQKQAASTTLEADGSFEIPILGLEGKPNVEPLKDEEV